MQQAAAKDPDNPDVPVELARVDWRQGDAEAARARLEPYYAKHPDSGKAAALLAGLTAGGDPERSARYRQAAEALVRGDALHYALGIAESDPPAAVEHFTAALEANPWMFDALAERAMRLRALEDLEAARRDVDLAVRVRPELPMTHVLRGALLLDQGDNAEAIRSLTMAIEMEPDWIAHFNRAIAHARERRLDKALTDLDAGLTFAPEEVRLHRERGRTLFDLGRFDEAAAAHGRVIEVGGATADAHWDRGSALMQADRYDEAEAAFTTALGLLPADDDRNRALLLADRGHERMLRDDLAAAEEDLRRSLALDADFNYGHMSLCHLLWRLGRYEEAVASCERGVELKGDRPVYVMKRGLAYWFAGDYEKALPDVSAYKTREPADAAWIPLWEWALHHQVGDAEAAGEALTEAARSEDATVRELAQLLGGSTAVRDLPASATDEEARFKARVILGLHATLAGDLAAAKAHLEEALTTNFRRDLEYELARWATRR